MIQRLWYATLFLLIPAPMMSAAEPSPVPKRFSAYIGGFMGASYAVQLRDGTLTYTAFDREHSNPKQATITPTEAHWREFRQMLDDLKVWQWRAEYRSDGVIDGTHWSLEISYADHALKTNGDNSYPDASGKPNGKPDPTKAFNRYLGAIKKLTGGKSFQ